MPSTGASNSGLSTYASNSASESNRRTPRPLPPWLCFVMNGTSCPPVKERAASFSPVEPNTAVVRGTSNPASRSRPCWATLDTSSSRTWLPFTTVRPARSSQPRIARVYSLLCSWPRVWLLADMRLQ